MDVAGVLYSSRVKLMYMSSWRDKAEMGFFAT